LGTRRPGVAKRTGPDFVSEVNRAVGVENTTAVMTKNGFVLKNRTGQLFEGSVKTTDGN
jgi:hypothetical protein